MTVNSEVIDGVEIDFTELEAKYKVTLNESLDTVLLIDRLPKVDRSKEEKLLAVLRKNVFSVAKASPIADSLCMPRENDNDMSKGYLFVEFETAEEATAVLQVAHGYRLDKSHVLSAVRLSDFDRILNMDEQYQEPEAEVFEERGYLRSWLTDPAARDQFVALAGTTASVFWNSRGGQPPEAVYSKPNWTELYVQWSPRGLYLASLYTQGVMIYGGDGFNRLGRFPHPNVKLIGFSNTEQFLVSWSPFDASKPTEHNLLVWDVMTGKLARGFIVDEITAGGNTAGTVSWPMVKYSHDDKYAARIQGGSLYIFELPTFTLLDKKVVKVEGLKDFTWSPIEDCLVHWTQGTEDVPARVSLMQVPSRNIIRTKNLFNVNTCQVHWQSRGDYLCVQVERHSKNKKHVFSNLELFRLRQKDVPIDCIEFKDPITSFAWEPDTDRFLVASMVEFKTTIGLYTMRAQENNLWIVKKLHTLERKVINRIIWSPRGENVLFFSFDSNSAVIEFWNAAEMITMASREHFLGTDVAWDPTGRYVASWVSSWKQSSDHGFVIWDVRGEQQCRINMTRLAVFNWRPRPASLISREAQKEIRRNLKNYAIAFEEADLRELSKESSNSKEIKSRLVALWNEWRRHCRREYESRNNLRRTLLGKLEDSSFADKTTTMEEWIEEVVDETEELIDN